jgi:hypothetical protein
MWRTLAIFAIVPLGACSGEMTNTGGGQTDARYDLSTTVHLASVQLPGGYDEALRALEGMEEDPAGTLIYILREVNPAAAAVLDFIPGPVEGKFKEWVNEYIFARVYEGAPATEQFGELAAQVSMMLDRIDLATRLESSGEGSHELEGIAFDLYGTSILVSTEDVGITEPIVTRGVAVTREGDALAIGQHGLDVPVGPFAVFALDTALRLKFGTDLEGLVLEAIDCDGLAQTVSQNCVTLVTEFCVGHPDELLQFCQAGAAAVADYVEGRITDLAIEAELRSGQATLAGETVENGVWDAQVNMGLGDMAPEATFTGHEL